MPSVTLNFSISAVGEGLLDQPYKYWGVKTCSDSGYSRASHLPPDSSKLLRHWWQNRNRRYYRMLHICLGECSSQSMHTFITLGLCFQQVPSIICIVVTLQDYFSTVLSNVWLPFLARSPLPKSHTSLNRNCFSIPVLLLGQSRCTF